MRTRNQDRRRPSLMPPPGNRSRRAPLAAEGISPPAAPSPADSASEDAPLLSEPTAILSLGKEVNNEDSDVSADAPAANDDPDITPSPGCMEGNEPAESEAAERKIQPTTRENTLPVKSSQFIAPSTSQYGEPATAWPPQPNFGGCSDDMTGAAKAADETGTDSGAPAEAINEAACNKAEATKVTDNRIGDAPEAKVESKGDPQIADRPSAAPRDKELRGVQWCTSFDRKEDAPTTPSKPILDSSGNPAKFNQNDVILSLRNANYKNIMYAQFKKLGRRKTEEDEKTANEIFQMFKKGGGRFFRLETRLKSVMLNDREALHKIKEELRNRNQLYRKWKHIDRKVYQPPTVAQIFDDSGNPTERNQKDVFISMTDSNYKNIMHAHFIKLGKRRTGEDDKVANEIFQMFKKRGGRFFKQRQHTFSTFDQVNEENALEKIKSDIFSRLVSFHRWHRTGRRVYGKDSGPKSKPSAVFSQLLDGSGNPTKFNHGDDILAMENPDYKKVMLAQFKILGPRSKDVEEDRKAVNKVFRVLKERGGRFFRLHPGTGKIFEHVDDERALEKIRRDIFDRMRNKTTAWLHQESDAGATSQSPASAQDSVNPKTERKEHLVQLQKDGNALATTTCEHKYSNAATIPSMGRSSGRKRNRPQKFVDPMWEVGAQGKRKKKILGVQSAPVDRPFTPREKRHFEQGCKLWGWGNWEQIQKESLPSRTVEECANHAAMIAEEFPEIKSRLTKEHHEIVSTLESDDEDELGASIWNASRTARLLSVKTQAQESESESGIKAAAVEPASSDGSDDGGSECRIPAVVDATAPRKIISFDPAVEANDPDHEGVGAGSPMADIAKENKNEKTPCSGGSAFASNPSAETKSLRARKPTPFYGGELGLEEKRAAQKQKLHKKDTPRAKLPPQEKKAPPESMDCGGEFDPEVEANGPDHEDVGAGSLMAEIAMENKNEKAPRSGGRAFASNASVETKSLRKRKPTLFFSSEFGLEEKLTAQKQKLHKKETPRAKLQSQKKKVPPELLDCGGEGIKGGKAHGSGLKPLAANQIELNAKHVEESATVVPKPNGNAGVCERGGKWRVRIKYQKHNRCFGTYGSREEALLANRIAREQLEAINRQWSSDHKPLTNDKIESNVKKAKEAVAMAMGRTAPEVPKSNGTGGVYERGGKWRVSLKYQQRTCCFGTYGSREEALLANRIAREQLEAPGGSSRRKTSGYNRLSAEKINWNVQNAKEAVAMRMGTNASGSSGSCLSST